MCSSFGRSCLLFSAQAATDYQLALHHAPVHYQNRASTDYKSDCITAIDYDSHWVGTNNWNNLSNDLWFDQEHENDLEGAVLVVRKGGSADGTL